MSCIVLVFPVCTLSLDNADCDGWVIIAVWRIHRRTGRGGGQGAAPPNSGSLSTYIRAESRHNLGKTQYMFATPPHRIGRGKFLLLPPPPPNPFGQNSVCPPKWMLARTPMWRMVAFQKILYAELALGRRTTSRPHLRYKEFCVRDMCMLSTSTLYPGRALQLIAQSLGVP